MNSKNKLNDMASQVIWMLFCAAIGFLIILILALAIKYSPHRRCAASRAAEWNASAPAARAWRQNELTVRARLTDDGHAHYTIGKGEYITANCLR